ncbi:hypothetical protein [Commensalibacter oyaizuii]|uniref:Uncharacterized protein n=1 Tax=Commensalibacter oyaizuii TaxID=3043873 RepID=A0ABT6Q269_9PROT|nr:hypothetical protein [Commensalibacter sp. TBRC 16381]MDI2091200.1 hypothetical protein [Commensalibacter sp. TBRC 16381]
MKKYSICLATIMAIAYSMTSYAYAKDSFFIKQDKYDSWVLSEFYNNVSLASVKGSSPLTIEIKPYQYSSTINISYEKLPTKFNPTLELDVGDFNCELTRVGQTNTYTTTLEPMDSLLFFNALKDQKDLIIYAGDDTTIKISLNGMDKAIEAMEEFAKNHYITLPRPFSAKIDVYSTMQIPNIVPSNIYPIFRQQAYFRDICDQEKEPAKRNQEQKDACVKTQTLTELLKTQGLCQTRQVILPQSYLQTATVSYQWKQCPSEK